ncbi:MAG: DUF1801 domain-containing protein, partial [Mycoplasmataceae bacterium]|nr:DUF1801 domain-containing protein [Mycoplasmataceae bacterium]
EEYIARYNPEIRIILNNLCVLIEKIAPETSKRMCLNIPTFDLNGKWFVHFAVFKNHIGFYPQPDAIIAFAKQLQTYKTSKGAIQFPLKKPIPYDLIASILRWKITQVKNN